jgi:PAP2 superfamily
MRTRGLALIAAVVVVVALEAVPVGARPATTITLSPQVALDWNLNAVNAVRGATVPLPKFPAEGMIYMAYVQAAVYDAVTKIEGRYRPYHRFHVGSGVDVADASPNAAVVAASYTTLTHYLGDQPQALLDGLTAEYDASVAALPHQGKADGLAVGEAAANDIIALRTGDGLADPSVTFTPAPPGPGVYEFAPAPSLQFAQTPWVMDFKPFLLRSDRQFRPGPPPALSSRRWAHQFNEVKAFGSATSTVRTAGETATAWFWNANVVNQYNQTFRDLATARGFDLVETVRLMAMGDMVGADALTECLAAKYHFAFWRPVTAIRAANIDGNPRTKADPTWTPLLLTPNHPEYPSAHGAVTGAVADVLAAVLGTKKIDLNIPGFDPGNGLMDLTRHFATVGDLRREIVNARTWAGLHYRFSTRRGLTIGRKTARWALARFFRPV